MQYDLSPYDSFRANQLAREIQERIDEMTMIISSIAGIQFTDSTSRRVVHQTKPAMNPDAAADSPAIVWVEIFDATTEHPQMCVVAYDDGHGGVHGVLEVPCGTPITG